ncbi:unnamed protein product, partial [Porites evermanni]
FLKEENVHFFVTYNETKAQVVERFNRTLKQLMWRMFTTTSSYHYLDKLDGLVNGNCNQSIHRSIKMKPADPELQKVLEKPDHLFRIEKILKYRGKGASKEASVHWKGWPKKCDSWIPYKQLVSSQ